VNTFRNEHMETSVIANLIQNWYSITIMSNKSIRL